MRTLTYVVAVGFCGSVVAAQLAAPLQPARLEAVRPIEPPSTPLPSESASAATTRFSFIVYGDTRSGAQPDVPGDGKILNPEHTRVVERMLATIKERVNTPFPIRFVLQSGDAVLRGQNAEMWNISFSPVIERLTRGANIPYFFSVGNHDVTTMPAGEPGRALGLHNTLTAMSRLIPAEFPPIL